MTREDAIKLLRKLRETIDRNNTYSEAEEMGIQALEQAKTGHWIDTGSGQMCSRCGEIQYGYDSFRRFCASCGIRMESEQ